MEYSPFALEIESDQTQLLDTCKELGVAVVAYSPLGRGFFTGQIKSRKDIENDWRKFLPKFSEENFPKNLELADQIKVIAHQKGVANGQLVLAWLMNQWEMVIPIPGTRSKERMAENLAAAKVQLTGEEDREIRRIVEAADNVGARYPEVMLSRLFGETPELKE
jgi:aryl-alcohol dehydrogenase-like predicted oxidoreductase